jgi:hypothetical protein
MKSVWQNKPAVNSSESPGKKNPKKRPVSAKTTIRSSATPPILIIVSGLRDSGMMASKIIAKSF